MREDNSYGIIPFRKEEGDWQMFLVQHLAGYWSFPKGHSEEDEKPQQTAEREFKEETGLQVDRFLPYPQLQEQYQFERDGKMFDKTVIYFLAEASGIVQLQEEEIRDGRWFALTEVEQQLTYPEAKRVAKEAITLIKNHDTGGK